MRILAVDDEESQLDRLENAIWEICPDAEYRCFQKPNEAIAYFRESPCDVALLDIQMGGMNGVVLAKKLKELKDDVNIIFCTGYSEYAVEALRLHVSGYMLKPVEPEDLDREIKALRHPVPFPIKKRIHIQTFGNFEVFCDGKPLDFPRSKSKEILAYLVDRQGSSATTAEIAAILWEDGIFDTSRQKQYQVYYSEMIKTLKTVQAQDIIVKTRLGVLIDKSKVDCDLFNLTDGDASQINRYTGKYMGSYSWAESTFAYLDRIYR